MPKHPSGMVRKLEETLLKLSVEKTEVIEKVLTFSDAIPAAQRLSSTRPLRNRRSQPSELKEGRKVIFRKYRVKYNIKLAAEIIAEFGGSSTQ